jgi:PAS domain S-box-containing protein
VVEDSPTQAEAVRAVLQEAGFEVVTSADGRQALDQLRRTRFDLVLSDILMPGLSGYELCRAVKADPLTRDVPVVLLTTLGDAMDIIRGLEVGADNYVTKPYRPDQLIGRIKKTLDNHHSRPEAGQPAAQVAFMGRRFAVHSNQEQILNLLASTLEDVYLSNLELQANETELRATQDVLETYTQQLEGKVRASNEKYWSLMENANDAILLLDTEGKFLELNRRARDLLGLSPDEGPGQSFEDFVPEEEREAARARWETLLARGGLFAPEARLQRTDGGWIWVDTSGSLVELDGARIALLIVHDVNERKRAERALRRQAERQAAVARLGQSALAGWNATSLAEEAVRVLSDTLEVELAHVLELLPEGDTLLLRAGAGWKEGLVGSATLSARALAEAGCDLLSSDPQRLDDFPAQPHWQGFTLLREHQVVSGLSVTVPGRERPLGVLGAYSRTARDFSEEDVHFLRAVAHVLGTAAEQQQTEQARARLVRILEATTDCVTITDPAGRRLYLNRAGRRLLGVSPSADISQTTLFDQRPAWCVELLRGEALPTALREGAWSGEAAVLGPEGEEIPLLQTLLAHRAPDGTLEFFSSISRDIRDLKALEQQVHQSQKMEAVGRLAGGVAHDFNNLLTVISGHVDLLRSRLEESRSRPGEVDLVGQDLDQIGRAAQRAAALTRQLLAFSRKQVLRPQVLDLNAVVLDLEKMLRRLIGEDVELASHLAPDLGRAKADPGQMEQVIMNLAVNARDAMPEGGRLTIETVNVELDEAYARRHVAVQPGRYVRLAVSDTGCGMDAATRSHLFEPFFTTKEQGKGTGLGLSTVYGIVKQSGGNIWVYSEPGGGTTFKIYLPRVDEPLEPLAPARKPLESVRGSETILLVEDEDPVRELARRVLENSGYTVLAAANGVEALKVAGEHAGVIHLMVSDVVMPEMSGRELARRAAVLRPDMKVLYSSGYSDKAVFQHGVLAPGAAFIEKPFTPEGLVRKVREVLGEREPGGV